ncbi:hypothetical protein [Thalassospira alkalitolerans]|uniref:hypothetical protein n=1 Tax=Thalassospira alkalitolerans TaxID=1293890 RepID=UPI003AA87B42
MPLVVDNIAQQLSAVLFRRAMKRSVQNAMRLGAGGIALMLLVVLVALKSPAPNGIVKSCSAAYALRADADYGTSEAHTTYGVCGLKV